MQQPKGASQAALSQARFCAAFDAGDHSRHRIPGLMQKNCGKPIHRDGAVMHGDTPIFILSVYGSINFMPENKD
jgi:hypothetical protein